MAAFDSALIGDKKYRYTPGSRFTVDAEIVGRICEELEAEGNLSAQALVDISRPEDSVTHKLFEWRDDVAAEKYREWQGRNVINHLEIVIPEMEKPTKGFFSFVQEKNEYHSTSVILESADKLDALLEQAKREANSYKKKYEILKQLKKIFSAIDETFGETS